MNELQLLNITGPIDGQGQREPWVELFNSGLDPLDLSSFFLSQSPTNLPRWAFPPGTSIGSGEFRLVWLDGDAVDHTPSEWHGNFRLTTNDSTLLLSRNLGSRLEVVDYLAIPALRADQSLARVLDGTSERPRVLDYHTATASNSGAPPLPALFINEILAANTFWPDPADGDTDDWFEICNDSERTVNLAGYTLTDRPGLPRKSIIPDGIAIGPRGFCSFGPMRNPGKPRLTVTCM